MTTCSIELDVLPESTDHADIRDWTGLFLAGSLGHRLFAEAAGKPPSPRLCAAATRLEPRAWSLRIDPGYAGPSGEAIDAGHVAARLERLAAGAAGPLSWIGAEIDAVKVTSDTTVRLTLARPRPRINEWLTSPLFVPEVSGPYYEASMASDYVRCPVHEGDTWFIGAPERGSRFGTVIFRRTPDPVAGQRLFDAGELDVTCHTTHPGEERLADPARADLVRCPLAIAVELFVDENSDQLGSSAARWAVSCAVDRSALARALPAYRPLWHYAALFESSPRGASKIPGQRRDDARRLWRQGTMRRRHSLTMTYPDVPPNSEIARIVAVQIADVLGVDVVPVPITYTDYVARRSGVPADLHLLLSAPLWASPLAMLAPYHGAGPFATRLAGAGELHRLVIQAEEAEIPAARALRTRAANTAFLKEMTTIPLLRLDSVIRRAPGYEDIVPGPLGYLPLGRGARPGEGR